MESQSVIKARKYIKKAEERDKKDYPINVTRLLKAIKTVKNSIANKENIRPKSVRRSRRKSPEDKENIGPKSVRRSRRKSSEDKENIRPKTPVYPHPSVYGIPDTPNAREAIKTAWDIETAKTPPGGWDNFFLPSFDRRNTGPSSLYSNAGGSLKIKKKRKKKTKKKRKIKKRKKTRKKKRRKKKKAKRSKKGVRGKSFPQK